MLSCSDPEKTEISTEPQEAVRSSNSTRIVVLGTAQDAGSPQIGCKKKCCRELFNNPEIDRRVTCLGLIDSENNNTYLFEASPDISRQMKMLTQLESNSNKEMVDGIFLTHAHIGHYTGLMYLGKEATDAQKVPIYAMPRMKQFLKSSGPWSQLVERGNIELKDLVNEEPLEISTELNVTPLLVPHRDEFSETVGYRIEGPNKSALFIPDIDKWKKWERDIVKEIKEVDYAFLDATFFSGEEINNRDISEIPHPFVIESLEKFDDLEEAEKNKIIFIHFNHTNPLLVAGSEASRLVEQKGFRIARIQDEFEM
jgi:pyrroloquinoline quinone biosynthesis protein B